MSFSSDVKEELCRQISSARHCQIAEISGIIAMAGEVRTTEKGDFGVLVHTENVFVARKYFTLLKKSFKISVDINTRKNAYLKKSDVYVMEISNTEDAVRVLKAANHGALLQKSCCKRAYLRGCFLASGSISAPEKFYHLEIACADREQAEKIRLLFQSFEIDAKIVVRKKMYVVYIKEGAQIVDALAVMEANIALMKLENIRILKEMRNSVNRKVNCEAANLNKTITAAVKQVEDIEYIEKTIGFGSLTPALRQMAEVRLEYPEASLVELGNMLDPPVGKSGVNHRLRKLCEIAKELQGNKEENYYD
ncbi:MAG: DNA-binding protein WhiA [Lachnospiraceae bacterium]|nr:DNA-binding protein WhiA [Lachnospiraceae bacterium]